MGNWNITDFYNDPNEWYGHGRALRGNAESALSRSAFFELRDLPVEKLKLSAENFVGGYELRDGKICLFRACGGGRERNGRPGRWVFLAFEADAKRFGGSDLIGTLTNGAFADYARTPVPPEAPCPPPDSEEPKAVPAGEKSEYRIPSALDERVERKFLAISRIGGETKVLAEKETRKPQPRVENVPEPCPPPKKTVRRGKKPSLTIVVLAAILVLAVILVAKTCSEENPRNPAGESSMVQEK